MVAVRAKCSGDWGESPCLLTDLSLSGAGFVCGHSPSIGEQVTLVFETDKKPVRILCSVRHVSDTHIGVAFLFVSGDEEQLRKLLKVA